MKAEATYKELLFVDQVRGSDATGSAIMTAKGSTDWIKSAGSPGHYYSLPDVEKYFQRANSSFAWIGHNRAGTVGKNSNDNAHPFEHNNILGVHNGTIRNKFEITKDGHKFDVDSDAFFNGVMINGLKETVKKTEGAFSVVYFDAQDKSINFARNDQRPMQFLRCSEKSSNVAIPDKEFIFFGSELGLLWWVCSRNGFICGEHHASTPLTHYKFYIGEDKPTISPLEAYVPKYAGTTYTSGGTSRSDWGPTRKEHHNRVHTLPDPRTPPVKTRPALLLTSSTGSAAMDNPAPFELRKMKWMNDSSTSAQDKKTLERIFRESVKGKTINFKAVELIDLGASYQIIGALAGRKKAGLPVIITTLVDKTWTDSNGAEAIFNATITMQRFTPDHNSIEIIVRDPHEIFNNIKEAALNAE